MINDRKINHQGLVGPELAVLTTYGKIHLCAELVESDLPENPFLGRHIETYFPPPLAERYSARMGSHRLRREYFIIATIVANQFVVATPDVRMPPTGAIHPIIDGEVTSYFEWMGAGEYHVDERSGSMHGKKFLVSEVLFGSDGESLFVRVDFRPGSEPELAGMEARFSLQSIDGAPPQPVTIRLTSGAATSQDPVECAFSRILEARFPLACRRSHRRPRRAIPALLMARGSPGGRRPAAGLAGDADYQPRRDGGLRRRPSEPRP